MQDTCEAARRALLSQGYIITVARSDAITGSKRFQPEGEVHIEISFHVVCVPEGADGALATAYVSAQQDRYVLKKLPNNTSLGVGPFGSISVPLSSSEDSLVKVGSETIPAGQFYDRYFALVTAPAGRRGHALRRTQCDGSSCRRPGRSAPPAASRAARGRR